VSLLLPFQLAGSLHAGGWLRCAAPGKAVAAQADARSLMTGRITDAYTNISTRYCSSASATAMAHFARSAIKGISSTACPDAPGQRL
jgi:hypothetical protein